MCTTLGAGVPRNIKPKIIPNVVADQDFRTIIARTANRTAMRKKRSADNVRDLRAILEANPQTV